jgi:hypothetical protein
MTGAGALSLTPAEQKASVLLGAQLDKIGSVNDYKGFAELTSCTHTYQSQLLHQMTLQRDKLGAN